MRGFRDWILKPFLTAVFVIVLAGLIHAFVPQKYSLTTIRDSLVRKSRPDYDRKLSDALLAELLNGGFTFFVRHASRDQGRASIAIDRALLLDKTFVPTEYQRGPCLNELGRVESQTLGYFLRAARIPISEVVASPVCRARETAELSLGRVDRFDPSLIWTTLLAPGEEREEQKENLRSCWSRHRAPGRTGCLWLTARCWNRSATKTSTLKKPGW
jgi:hypothetical protein